ncbi:MAG TPA: hypothetical protein VGX91_05330, partial [Candidatus Cybelea sp.]|nr:hypothetical protein [Candidatus Cybelea sp.]
IVGDRTQPRPLNVHQNESGYHGVSPLGDIFMRKPLREPPPFVIPSATVIPSGGPSDQPVSTAVMKERSRP